MWFLLLTLICSVLSVMNLDYFFFFMSIPFGIGLLAALAQYPLKESIIIAIILPFFIFGLLTF